MQTIAFQGQELTESMQIRPCREAQLDSDAEIHAEVLRMLDACGVDGPPTPIDTVLEFQNLSREAQDSLRPRLPAKLFRRVKRKIRGLLSIPDRLVAVDDTLHPHRQRFVTFHEVGHDLLPWHHDLFVVTSEWDLSPRARQRFESEANLFAAKSIFQGEHMAGGYRGGRLKMTKLAGLAARYASSLTATAIQYVSVQDRPVALVVGRPARRDGLCGVALRFGVANDAFLKEFESDIFGDYLPGDHPVCGIFANKGSGAWEARMVIRDRRLEERSVIVDCLYNHYDLLCLVHPLRARRRIFGFSSRRPRKDKAA